MTKTNQCQIKFDKTIDNATRRVLQCVADYGMGILELNSNDVNSIKIKSNHNDNTMGCWYPFEHAITVYNRGDMVVTMLHELYHAFETRNVIMHDTIYDDEITSELNAESFAQSHAHRAMDSYIYGS